MSPVGLPALIGIVVAAVAGSSALTALVTNLFTRRHLAAESEQIRMQTADNLITRLSLQLNDAITRISSLEKSERVLQDRVQHLEWMLKQNGIEVPPDLIMP